MARLRGLLWIGSAPMVTFLRALGMVCLTTWLLENKLALADEMGIFLFNHIPVVNTFSGVVRAYYYV